jgi:hypothetical protein
MPQRRGGRSDCCTSTNCKTACTGSILVVASRSNRLIFRQNSDGLQFHRSGPPPVPPLAFSVIALCCIDHRARVRILATLEVVLGRAGAQARLAQRLESA